MRKHFILILSIVLYSLTTNLGATIISRAPEHGTCNPAPNNFSRTVTVIDAPYDANYSCNVMDPSGSGASVDVGYSFSTNFAPGSLGASVSASLFASSNDFPISVSAGGRVSTRLFENIFLTNPGEANFLSLTGQLTGNLTQNFTLLSNPNARPMPRGQTAISLIADTINGSDTTLFEVTTPDTLTSFNQVVDEMISFTIPFNNAGASILDVTLETFAACTFGGSCNASSDFLGTFLFTGGQLLDANMNALQNIDLTSDSGFDYLAGLGSVDPIDPPTTPVPEPSTWLLLLGGLIFMKNTVRLNPNKS